MTMKKLFCILLTAALMACENRSYDRNKDSLKSDSLINDQIRKEIDLLKSEIKN